MPGGPTTTGVPATPAGPPKPPLDPAFLAAKAKVELVRGDIALLEADGIVNAANNDLILGGGVAAAIRRGGGPTIQEACNKIGTIPIGEAAVTTAGDLKAKWVIHAASMSLGGWATEEGVRNATRNALKRADERGMRTIAFPAIGTGVAGFSMDRCARIMCRYIVDHMMGPTPLEKVTLVLWDEDALTSFKEQFDVLLPAPPKRDREPRPDLRSREDRGGRRPADAGGRGRPDGKPVAEPGKGEARRRRRGGRGRGRRGQEGDGRGEGRGVPPGPGPTGGAPGGPPGPPGDRPPRGDRPDRGPRPPRSDRPNRPGPSDPQDRPNRPGPPRGPQDPSNRPGASGPGSEPGAPGRPQPPPPGDV